MERNLPSHGQAPQSRLGDFRVGGYDSINAQRYVEQGELLAELVLRASRGVRTLMERAVNAARSAFAHNRNLAKNHIAQID